MYSAHQLQRFHNPIAEGAKARCCRNMSCRSADGGVKGGGQRNTQVGDKKGSPGGLTSD